MNNKYKILLVEDDENIRIMVGAMLESSGYQVIETRSGATAMTLASSHIPDLILLDLGLPDMDGMEILEYVRKTDLVPIIVLSARSDEAEKVKAFDLGANDYITKPFGTGELLARVRASLRINRMNLQAAAPSNVFVLEDLTIDYDRRQVSIGGNAVHLTQIEFNILSLLSQQVGKVMTYSAIISAIWGTMDEGSIKKLQVNMANIRKKLGCRPGENRYIINELGVGYRMLDPQE